jgi:hypothetical protein
VQHDGITYTMPGPDTPDNVLADGQTIPVSGQGNELGVLDASAYGSASATFVVSYTDGSTSTATVTIPDWYTGAAAGSDIAATVPWHSSSDAGSHPVNLYATSIPIDPNRTVAAVTLPNIGDSVAPGQTSAHIFAIGIGSQYADLAAAYDNDGITTQSAPSTGGFDGDGSTYNGNQLIANDLGPGATARVGSLTYTMPGQNTDDNSLPVGLPGLALPEDEICPAWEDSVQEGLGAVVVVA